MPSSTGRCRLEFRSSIATSQSGISWGKIELVWHFDGGLMGKIPFNDTREDRKADGKRDELTPFHSIA